MPKLKSDREVYVVECIRTPIGRGKADGSLHHVHPVHLLAHTLNELVKRRYCKFSFSLHLACDLELLDP